MDGARAERKARGEEPGGVGMGAVGVVEVEAFSDGRLPRVAGEDNGPADLLSSVDNGTAQRGLRFRGALAGPCREQSNLGSKWGDSSCNVLCGFNKLFRILKRPQAVVLKHNPIPGARNWRDAYYTFG